jgi:arabinofuranosyltransferase
VRPELALVSIVFALAVWLLERPPWRRTLALVALAIALPLAYEVFRAGYYGTLVPLPALAKSAAQAAWARGFAYARDFAHPYALWIPALALIGFAATSDFAVPRRALIVIATPIVAGLVLALYVVRVGGDFMHARMLLAPVFLVLLPAFMLPLRRRTVPVAILLAAWALAVGVARGDGKSHATIAPIEDERAGYVRWTGRNHPTDPARFAFADRPTSAYALTDILLGRHRLLTWGVDVAMNPERPGPIVYATGRLGTGGVVAPLDAIVADTLGLANPLGARITATLPGYPGHEKPLPMAWLLADYADPSARLPGVPAVQVDAARRAMRCGDLAELLASVRAPLTPSRFWANLTGAPRRTRLAIPVDPAEAERRFCGECAQSVIVTASTSWELDGWGRYEVVDGERGSTPDSPGYTSTADAPQWIALDYATPRALSQVVLYPALDGAGFPVDVTIQIWDGAHWIDRATRTGMTAAVQTLAWSPADRTSRVRVLATKLPAAAKPELKLAEIEALP